MESLNRVLTKTLKTEGWIPTEQAATKLIYLATVFNGRFDA